MMYVATGNNVDVGFSGRKPHQSATWLKLVNQLPSATNSTDC